MIPSNWPSLDPVLGKWIPQISPLGFVSTHNPFHDLVSCVVEQQIHYRSTKKIFERAISKAQITLLTPDNFPVFEEKALQYIKISQKKYETLSAVCDFFSSNSPDWNSLSDDDIRSILKSIPGIGPWTQEMILLFTFERKNAFPVDDFHLQQIMTRLYELDTTKSLKKKMKDIATLWEGNSSLACLYLWELKRLKRMDF